MRARRYDGESAKGRSRAERGSNPHPSPESEGRSIRLSYRRTAGSSPGRAIVKVAHSSRKGGLLVSVNVRRLTLLEGKSIRLLLKPRASVKLQVPTVLRDNTNDLFGHAVRNLRLNLKRDADLSSKDSGQVGDDLF